MEYNIGDVVGLKSGSPNMTVGAYDAESGEVTCIWFTAASGDPKWHKFPSVVLERRALSNQTAFGVGQADNKQSAAAE